jgi:hypothetical protein
MNWFYLKTLGLSFTKLISKTLNISKVITPEFWQTIFTPNNMELFTYRCLKVAKVLLWRPVSKVIYHDTSTTRFYILKLHFSNLKLIKESSSWAVILEITILVGIFLYLFLSLSFHLNYLNFHFPLINTDNHPLNLH